MPVFERMTIRAKKHYVFRDIVLPITVLVMKAKDFRMFRISTFLASINRKSTTFKGSSPSICSYLERLAIHSAFSAAKTCFVLLSFVYRKLFSAEFTGQHYRTFVSCISHFRSALSRTIPLRLTSFSVRNEFLSTKTALSVVFHVGQIVSTLTFVRTKMSAFRSALWDVEFIPALFAEFKCSPPYTIFASFWSSHAGRIAIININVNGGINAP